ncbi:MAG: AAA family ATPase [bacterium]
MNSNWSPFGEDWAQFRKQEEPQKPTALKVIPENIPDSLKIHPSWGLWKYQQRGSKWTKPPYQLSGKMAGVDDKNSWTTYENALEAYSTGEYDGIGFMFSKESNVMGIDIDNCRNPETGEVKQFIKNLLKNIPTYIEVSPSGKGLHILAFGRLPSGERKKNIEDEMVFEMYDEGRYFTISGVRYDDNDSDLSDCTERFSEIHDQIFKKQSKVDDKYQSLSPNVLDFTKNNFNIVENEDDKIIEKIRNSNQSTLFNKLWSGDCVKDHSSDDLSLCNILSYWSNGNAQSIDRLFRRSGLMRPKWDEKRKSDGSTYGEMTISTAISGLNNKSANKQHINQNNITANVTRGDQIVMKKIDFVWNQWIASSMLNIIAGQPGSGKTTIALSIASIISRGGEFPDGTVATCGNVLIWSGEDGIAITLAPKLSAMGADLSNIYFVDGVNAVNGDFIPFDPAIHINTIYNKTQEIGNVSMIIVDPIVSAISGDSHKNAEVRRGLAPLVELGKETGAAILGITHLSKGTQGREPIDRITGSLAFCAVARIVMIATKLKSISAGYSSILARAKSNIGPDDCGFGYNIELRDVPKYSDLRATCIKWGELVSGSAKDILDAAEDVDNTVSKNQKNGVSKWLENTLKSEGGSMSSEDVIRSGINEGYSESTIRRVCKKIGIISRISGFGCDKESTWSLPND